MNFSETDIVKLEKMFEEILNEPKEELTSEEFERKYPRKHTPYELQRLENVARRRLSGDVPGEMA